MNNIKTVISSFTKNYKPIPLEIFRNNPYKVLISTILSSRTKDEVTLEASKRLFKAAPNVKKLNCIDEMEIRKYIYPVGFYKQKAKYLKELSNIIIKKYHNNIPFDREKLMKLPGVGRKTANLVLVKAYAIPAISVDTHVHKISNLLGLVKTKTPIQTEKELVQVVPKKYWKDINRLFVSIGRQYTTKKRLMNFLRKEKLIK